jgi:hypothetical protein
VLAAVRRRLRPFQGAADPPWPTETASEPSREQIASAIKQVFWFSAYRVAACGLNPDTVAGWPSFAGVLSLVCWGAG